MDSDLVCVWWHPCCLWRGAATPEDPVPVCRKRNTKPECIAFVYRQIRRCSEDSHYCRRALIVGGAEIEVPTGAPSLRTSCGDSRGGHAPSLRAGGGDSRHGHSEERRRHCQFERPTDRPTCELEHDVLPFIVQLSVWELDSP